MTKKLRSFLYRRDVHAFSGCFPMLSPCLALGLKQTTRDSSRADMVRALSVAAEGLLDPPAPKENTGGSRVLTDGGEV